MRDRGMKKWRPFNSVVPSRELLEKNEPIVMPVLSKDEIMEFEELLKTSYYTHEIVRIEYYDKGKKAIISGYVVRFDAINKNIYLNNRVINFRQIFSVK